MAAEEIESVAEVRIVVFDAEIAGASFVPIALGVVQHCTTVASEAIGRWSSWAGTVAGVPGVVVGIELV